MASFPLMPEELAVVLGKPMEWVEDMRRAGLPVAVSFSTGAWWLSDAGQLATWQLYANPPEPPAVQPAPPQLPTSSRWEPPGAGSDKSSPPQALDRA
jgi:hypothetical protein